MVHHKNTVKNSIVSTVTVVIMLYYCLYYSQRCTIWNTLTKLLPLIDNVGIFYTLNINKWNEKKKVFSL